MVLAMVFAGVAVVLSDSEVNAADTSATVSSMEELKAVSSETTIILDGTFTINETTDLSDKTVIIQGNITVDGSSVTLTVDRQKLSTDGGSLTVKSGATVISDFGNAGTDITTLIGTSSPVVKLESGSITVTNIPAYTSSPGFSLVLNGTASVETAYTVYQNTTITVNSGSVLTINQAMTNNGEIRNYGTINAVAAINNTNGEIYGQILGGADKVTGKPVQDLGSLGFTDTVNTDTPVRGDAFLSGNITIPEGITFTITSNSTLDLMNYNITLYGTLVVERNATITSTGSADNSIAIMSTGSIQNSGIIGDSKTVRISNGADATQYVDMMGVSGVNFTVVKVTGGTYNLNVSGDVSRISGVYVPTLVLNKVSINADTTIANRVAFTATDVTVARNVTLTVNGTATVDIELDNGAGFVSAGAVTGTVGAKYGVVGTGNVIGTIGNTETPVNDVNAYVTLDGNARGLTFSVSRVTIPGETTSTIEQRFYVNGTAALVAGTTSNPIKAASIGFTGTIFVEELLFVPEEISVTGAFDLSAGGTIQAEQRETDLAITYTGAKYVQETTVESVKVETTYYTNFANAMAAIGTAQNGEIFVSGTFTVNENYTVGAGQYISLEGSESYVITVGENSTITVEEDGTIDNNAIAKITGQVIVNDGGMYRPTNTATQSIYEVRTNNEGTGVTVYSGFKVALDNAGAGDVIEVVSSTAEYKGNMTIISGVTVNLADGCQLTVTGNVTVQSEGALNLGSGAELIVGTAGKTSTVNVAGTIDAEDGTLSATDTATINLYSTGSVITSAEISGIKANSAYYQDVTYVYTSAAAAAAYAAENAITTIYATGTFSEAGDVTLDGITLSIKGTTSDVTLGNVAISNGAKISIDSSSTGAKYSANVSGLSGEGDAAVNSTVQVVDTAAEIASSSVLGASGAYDYALTISAIDGNVTVSAGTVELTADDEITVSITNVDSLSISAGAMLVIGSETGISLGTSTPSTLTSNDYLVNDGTIAVEAQFDVDGTMTIPGTIIVRDGGALNVTAGILTVTGDVTVSAEEDHEGTMTVTGNLYIGAAPEMLGDSATGSITGTVTLVNNAYVAVFNGASVANATITNATNAAVKTTAFVINGIDYATMYATGNADFTAINTPVNTLQNLDSDERAAPKWYSGETEITGGNVGDYAELTAEITYAEVDFKISAGPGLTIYIDELRAGTTGSFTIGEHTITVYVNAGYEGTPTITINGQAITGGTFTVTTDMIDGDNVIYATGASPATGTTSGGDDGMGLTEILLIILVILIVVMAIMVALRLMRS